ncbi:MAG: NAD-dependent epimerase/dehydratase family protein [Pseudomonadota bacterium]|nr:NAD-dependent epimerase/dehydratase family protein [Pseudomonadota bacterium]
MGLVPFQGKVLVTGAGGFIGRALCARFASTGVAHVGAVRAIAPRDARGTGHVALGDFAAADWHDVLDGVDAIVHLAGRAHARGRDANAPTPYIVANVHVTRRLAEAAVRSGVRRIVFASSVKVYGEASEPGRAFRAGDASAPQDAYAKSKAEAERVLHEICGAHGIDAIVLRFPLTYGPGVKGNFLALLEAVAERRRLPLLGIVNRRSLLYLGNAVSAIEAALVAPALTGEALPVADAKPVSTPELVTKIALALRLQSRLYHLPAPLLRAGAALSGRRAAVDRLLDSLEVDALRFRGLTGWSPSYSIDEGLAATAAWWRMRHAQ